VHTVVQPDVYHDHLCHHCGDHTDSQTADIIGGQRNQTPLRAQQHGYLLTEQQHCRREQHGGSKGSRAGHGEIQPDRVVVAPAHMDGAACTSPIAEYTRNRCAQNNQRTGESESGETLLPQHLANDDTVYQSAGGGGDQRQDTDKQEGIEYALDQFVVRHSSHLIML